MSPNDIDIATDIGIDTGTDTDTDTSRAEKIKWRGHFSHHVSHYLHLRVITWSFSFRLFSLITVYLVAGAAFMHFKRGARGLEHIPNLNLWRRLGNLSADGCDFCCRCERPVSRAGYFLQESEVDMSAGDDDILSP